MSAPGPDDTTTRTLKQVTRTEWAVARRHGYTGCEDGKPHMLHMDARGGTVYGPVEVVADTEE